MEIEKNNRKRLGLALGHCARPKTRKYIERKKVSSFYTKRERRGKPREKKELRP